METHYFCDRRGTPVAVKSLNFLPVLSIIPTVIVTVQSC